jgi:hypothetical protein
MRAASSVAASLSIAGLALLAVAPMGGANAVAIRGAAETVEPCEPGQECDDDPVVTVTITETPSATQSPSPSASPTPVITATVTVTPTPTTAPTPTSAPVTAPAPIPTLTQGPLLPTALETPSPEPTISLAPAQPTVLDSPTPGVSFEEPAPDTVPIEIRNASPEFDQVTLSRKLAAPAALLVLLALLGWLVFEGRLRRMAHVAAVRKAGPRGGRSGGGDDVAGYPGAYAPMVGFVPVPTYPMAYQQYPPQYLPQPYGYPQPYLPEQHGYGYPAQEQGYGMPQAYGAPQQHVAPSTESRDTWGAAVAEPDPSTGVWTEATESPRPDQTPVHPLPDDPSSAPRDSDSA